MTIVVDVHNHAIPHGFVGARVRVHGESYGYTLEKPSIEIWEGTADGMYVEKAEKFHTPSGAIADLRGRRTDETLRQKDLAKAGIDFCFESLTPAVMTYGGDERQAQWGTRAINDGFIENLEAYPDRVSPAAHVPLHHPAIAAKELERVADHGLPRGPDRQQCQRHQPRRSESRLLLGHGSRARDADLRASGPFCFP